MAASGLCRVDDQLYSSRDRASAAMKTRRYSELRRIQTFEERFEYLNLKGYVGEQTFGFDRWMNQQFYRSREWKLAREAVIARDQGCDLGIPGHEIYHGLLVHHMNPLSELDLVSGEGLIIDPEFLISTSHLTHNAIHYGDASLLPRGPIERVANDTRLW
jgi:hypothetical protein